MCLRSIVSSLPMSPPPQVRGFFDSLSEETGSGLRCIQQTYESIEENIRWMDQHLPQLKAWLDRQAQGARTETRGHEDL